MNVVPVSTYLNTIPILFLTVSCNFTGNLLSCKNQQLFNDNMYVKHSILYFILLVTLVFANKSTFVEKTVEPPSFLATTAPLVLHSLVIYFIFMCVTKMKIQYIGFCLFLIIAHFFITDYKNTYVKEGDATTKEFYMNVEKGIQVLFAVTVVIGIVTYYLKQRADYGAQFELANFFFGTPKCKFSS